MAAELDETLQHSDRVVSKRHLEAEEQWKMTVGEFVFHF